MRLILIPKLLQHSFTSRKNEGFQKKAKLDLEGARTVLKLRSEFAKPQKNLTDPAKYIDESYYRKAVQ